MNDFPFTAVCPHCHTENKVTARSGENVVGEFFEEVQDFHCAYCGLKIGEVLSAVPPQTEIKEQGG